jgi:hypothetical protein
MQVIAGAHAYGDRDGRVLGARRDLGEGDGLGVERRLLVDTSSKVLGGHLPGQPRWRGTRRTRCGVKASYAWPFGLKWGQTIRLHSKQFTDYAQQTPWASTGGRLGQIPAYTLMGAFARLAAPRCPTRWQIEFTFGVKNLLN